MSDAAAGNSVTLNAPPGWQLHEADNEGQTKRWMLREYADSGTAQEREVTVRSPSPDSEAGWQWRLCESGGDIGQGFAPDGPAACATAEAAAQVLGWEPQEPASQQA